MYTLRTKKRKWTAEQLNDAAKKARSIRQVITAVGLIPAGGNYSQMRKYLKQYRINTSHFKGKGWNKGLRGIGRPRIQLNKILVRGGSFQSYKLKKRLFAVGLKKQTCEACGWARQSPDGRVPLELDHINGIATDNRLENLRVLCPNCHSLQLTHRGRNKKRK